MKKNDIILISVLIILTVILPFFLMNLNREKGSELVIYSDEDIYGTYELDEDREIEIDTGSGYNCIVIKDGNVYIKEADCKGQDCVRSGSISESGQVIACIPHRLLLKIKGPENEYDGVAY